MSKKYLNISENKALRFFGKLSIGKKITLAFFLIIVLMSSLNISLMLSSYKYNKQYNNIISNITTANSINGKVKKDIDYDLYQVVQGYMKFEAREASFVVNEDVISFNAFRFGY